MRQQYFREKSMKGDPTRLSSRGLARFLFSHANASGCVSFKATYVFVSNKSRLDDREEFDKQY